MAQSSAVNQPIRIPLAANIKARDGFKSRSNFPRLVVDPQLINCYAEFNPETKQFNIQKRPGHSPAFFSPPVGLGLGLFQFVPDIAGNPVTANDSFISISASGKVYLIFDLDNVFFSCSSVEIASVDTTGGQYKGLVMFDAVTNCKVLVIGNGIKAYYITGQGIGSLFDINDPDFPTLFYKGFAYLNSRLYVGQPNNILHGAEDLNDPAKWETLNVILAQDESDSGVGIAKHNSFIVFFKEYSTEFFYDNGNPTGSPLLPSPQNSYDIGCFDVDSIQDIDGSLFWVTSSKNRIPQVARMDGTQYSIISTPEIEKILLNGASTFSSMEMKIAGHRFYILRMGSFITLVYDLDQQLWYIWQGDIENGNAVWNISDCITTAKTVGFGVSYTILQDLTTGALYFAGPDYVYPTDDAFVFPVDIYTYNFDAGLPRIKNVNMLYFDTDRVDGSEIQVRMNDFDYDPNRWSNFRAVNLDCAQPQLPNCGSFYRRAHHIRHQKACSFIIRSMSMQADIGVS